MLPSRGSLLKLEILYFSTLQPSSTTTNYTTSNASYNISQYVSLSSWALEHMQGKYYGEVEQCHDLLDIEMEARFQYTSRAN